MGFLEAHDKEVKAIKEELMRICWFMRGGITYQIALDLAISERQIISNVIKSNLEIAKESRMPFW